MKQLLKTSLTFCFACCAITTDSVAQYYTIPAGKAIYTPKELKNNDFTSRNSEWSYYRMAATDNVVLFWQKGFGDDLSKAPQLEGHNMTVDKENLLQRIESYYHFFRDSLQFILPGSKAEKYRMMVMLNYSLEGTAYGGAYDDEIGALWIAPNRVQDKKLNCIAHELGHSFQIQNACDGRGHGVGYGFYEMASQWMLWQVNPEWVTDENYHWEAFRKLFHKQFLDGENIYHSPYVLEYWGWKHGRTLLGRIFREAQDGEDPLQTYMRLCNLDMEQTADEMYDCYSRLVTFDFPRVKNICRPYACQLQTPVSTSKKGFMPVANFLPRTFGFNVIELPLDKHSVKFQGMGNKKADGFRYGIVLVNKNKEATYLNMKKDFKSTINYDCTPETESAWLVVTAYPLDKYASPAFGPNNNKTDERVFPYNIEIK